MKDLILIFIFILTSIPLVDAQDVIPVSTSLEASAPAASEIVLDDADDANSEENAQDADDSKVVVDKVNEVIQKVYDRVMAAKAKYKELAGFDEKALTKDADGFLKLHYETTTPSSRGETYPYLFDLSVEPLKTQNTGATLSQGHFEYQLPLLDLQFSGSFVKHPLRRQFDIESLFEECAEDLVDYQQQFMPLRFMIIADQKVFKVREPIQFKVILLNSSEHNILVKGLSKDTLFFTLNRNVWGAQAGQVETLSPREQRARDRVKRAEMRNLLRKRKAEAKAGIKTIQGPLTHVGDQLILRAGEALSIEFTGEGYRRAQDVKIRGVYQMNVKGLRPTAKITLKIIDD